MKKLQLNLGGLPHFQEDLDWIQKGAEEALVAMATIYGSSNVILKGVEFNGTNITPGWVCLEGEVAYFPGVALSGTLPPGNWYIRLNSTYDPSGTQQYADGSTNSAYLIRRAIVVNLTTAPVDGVLYSAFVRPSQWVEDLAQLRPITSAPIALVNGWTAVSGSNPRAERYANGLIRLRGSITGGLTSTIVGNLPIGYMPNFAQEVNLLSVSLGEMKAYIINATGSNQYSRLTLFRDPPSSGVSYPDAFSLESFTWYI